MRRPRGQGGRFLTLEERAALEAANPGGQLAAGEEEEGREMNASTPEVS